MRKPCPSPQQQTQWGGWRIPWWLTLITFILTIGAMMYSDGISLSQAFDTNDWLIGGAVLLSVLYAASARINRLLAVRAYTRRFDRDERFLLLEYEAYLGRLVEQAGRDLALGGQREIARLQQTRQRLQELLAGPSESGLQPSGIAREIATMERTLADLTGEQDLIGLDLTEPTLPTVETAPLQVSPSSRQEPREPTG